MDAAIRERVLLLAGVEVRATQSASTGSGQGGGSQTAHEPAGSSKGGQFTSSPGGGGQSAAPSVTAVYKNSGGGSKAPTGSDVPQAPATPRTMQSGDSGEDVRYAQYAMNLLGFKVAQDGQYGADTEAAIRQMQQRLGIKPNGHLSPSMLHKMQDAVRLSPCVGGQRDLALEADWEERAEDLGEVDLEDESDDVAAALIEVIEAYLAPATPVDAGARARTLALLGIELRAHDVSAELRIPGGKGGGRWTKSPVTSAIAHALEEWGKGRGGDDPFVLDGKPIDRESLRKAAVARGITLKRGASRDDIVAALKKDIGGGASSEAPTAKKATSAVALPTDLPPSSLTAAEQARATRLVKADPQLFATVQDRPWGVSTSGNLSVEDADWLKSVFDREPAFVNRLAQAEYIDRELARDAGKAGVSVVEYKRDVATKLKEIVADKPIVTRVPNEAALEAILSGGRFKTSFEGARRGLGMVADSKRRSLGEEINGTPADTPVDRRPIYGYVAINDIEPALSEGKKIPGIAQREGQEDVLSSYGKVQVVLKPDVRARTTMAVGDSLDDIGFMRPSPIDNPGAESLGHRDLDQISEPGWTRRSYIEAQVHGGVTTADIAAVVFPSEPSAGTIKRLASHGIAWHVLRPGDKPISMTPNPRAAARERNRRIESAAAVEHTLADMDELLDKKADVSVFRERLDSAQGLDAKDVAALRGALGDPAKLRTEMARIEREHGITVHSAAGATVGYHPDLHEPLASAPAEGAPVTVVRRGTSLAIDGDTVRLNRAVVKGGAGAKAAKPGGGRDVTTDHALIRSAYEAGLSNGEWSASGAGVGSQRGGRFDSKAGGYQAHLALAKSLGFDAQPHILHSDRPGVYDSSGKGEREFQRLEDAGGTQLYRGWGWGQGENGKTGEQMAHEYMYGPLHVGGGLGLGTNFSSDLGTAAYYGEDSLGKRLPGGMTVTAILPKDARVISYADAVKRRDEFLAKLPDGPEYDAERKVFDDPGTFAMAQGYDAMVANHDQAKIVKRGTEEWVVFNRGKLTVWDDNPPARGAKTPGAATATATGPAKQAAKKAVEPAGTVRAEGFSPASLEQLRVVADGNGGYIGQRKSNVSGEWHDDHGALGSGNTPKDITSRFPKGKWRMKAAPKVDVEQAARDRQSRIDKARDVAGLLAEVEELHHNNASPQVMESRIRSREKLSKDLPAGVADEVAKAAALDQEGRRGLSADPAVRGVQVENRIRAAYNGRAEGARYVGLADLREQIGPDVSRAEVDAALTKLAREPGVHVAPADMGSTFPWAVHTGKWGPLQKRDHDAALALGDSPKHMISFMDPRGGRTRAEAEAYQVPLQPLPGQEALHPAAAIDKLAAEHGLHRTTGPAGSVEKFDPAKHDDAGAKLRPGADVVVVRPGYDATVDGERVPVHKAFVLEAGRATPAAPAKPTSPARTAKARPGSTIGDVERGPTQFQVAIGDADPVKAPLGDFQDRPLGGANGVVLHRGQPLPAGFKSDLPAIRAGKFEMRPGLSADESQALDQYALSRVSDPLNTALRQGKTSDFGTATIAGRRFDLDEVAQRLDAAIGAGELGADTRLYRGALMRPADIGKLQPGAVTGESGYLSTTTDIGNAFQIIHWRQQGAPPGRSRVVFEILAPKGTQAAVGHVEENEALLARGRRMRVVAVRRPVQSTDTRVITFELLPDAPGKVAPTKATSPADILSSLPPDLTPAQKRARLRSRGVPKDQIDALVPLAPRKRTAKAVRAAAVDGDDLIRSEDDDIDDDNDTYDDEPSPLELQAMAEDSAARSRELAMLGVVRAAGHDVTPGHDELHHYWTLGEGRHLWVDSPEPWTTLHALVTAAVRKNGRAVSPEQIDNWVSRWFIEVKGYAAGSDANRVAHGHPPRGHRIGPG